MNKDVVLVAARQEVLNLVGGGDGNSQGHSGVELVGQLMALDSQLLEVLLEVLGVGVLAQIPDLHAIGLELSFNIAETVGACWVGAVVNSFAYLYEGGFRAYLLGDLDGLLPDFCYKVHQINIRRILSKFLIQPPRHVLELAVDLPWRSTHDQAAEGVLGAPYVAEAAHQVDGTVGQDHPGLGCIFYCVFSFALLARNTCNTSRHVVALQILNILNLEGLQKQVVQSQHCDGVV